LPWSYARGEAASENSQRQVIDVGWAVDGAADAPTISNSAPGGTEDVAFGNTGEAIRS